MDFVQILKGFYYRAEDKWYDLLDAIDRKQIPIYKIIDPIDSVIPSFLLFILTMIFFLVLIAYIMQFYSPVEFTFKAVDSATKATLSGVAISGTINEEQFSKVTAQNGEAKLILKGKPANLFEKIGSIFFVQELEFNAILSAERSGYNKIENREYDLASKDATITLTAIKLSDPERNFTSSTDVELLDNVSSERIVDLKGTAYVKYGCTNKGMDQKTSSDGFDGSVDGKFKVIEPNCNFVIKRVYSPGYEELNGIDIELDPTKTLQTIRLTKVSSPTKGIAKIYVTEKNTSPLVPLARIQIRLLDLAGNSYEEGTTDSSGVFQKEVEPGTYIITATSLDGNYSSINSDTNELIVITVDKLSEKTISMQRLDPKLVRFLRLKVIDYNGRNPIKDVKIFPQRLVLNSDKNLDAKGIVGACTNSCRTDSNGLITISGLSSADEGKVIISLFKEDYIAKVFAPTFFKVNTTEFETVELEKADYNLNAGKGLVLVKAKNDSRPLSPAKTFLYFNSPELNINGISLIESGIITDSNGKALFTGLAVRKDKAYYANATYEGILEKSLNKSVGVGETAVFDINIGTEISFLEVNLVGYNGINLEDKNKAIVKMAPTSVTNPTFETLSFDKVTQTFKSKLHDKGREYLVLIDLNNYVPINSKVTLLREGGNLITKVMYPGNEGILAAFNGLFENLSSDQPATFLDLNNHLDATTKGYYAKLSFVIGKSLKDGNILGLLKVNDKLSITNISSITEDYLRQSEIYSCTLQEKFPYNDDNYYLPDNCVKTQSGIGKQFGAFWDGNVAAGVYDVTAKLVFTPNAKNGDILDLNYSGKESDFNFISEDRNRTNYIIGDSICKYSAGNPSCPGIFFYPELNNASLGTFDYNQSTKVFSKLKKYELDEDTANSLSVKIFNNKPSKIDLNLEVYSYNSLISSFSFQAGGVLHFDSLTGVQQKTIGSDINIGAFKKSAALNVNIFNGTGRSSSYIVLVAKLVGGENYLMFIDTQLSGKKLYLVGGNFLSGVPDQTFNSRVVNSNEDPIELSEISWSTFKDCVKESEPIASGAADIIGNEFAMEIKGVYDYNKDCLTIQGKAVNPLYSELYAELLAGTWGVEDPELSCVTPSVDASIDNLNAYLPWSKTTKLLIVNNCAEEIFVKTESRLLMSGECESLLPKERCEIIITAQNKDYNENIPFSDVLGVFPVYVKAKLVSSKKNFSQVKLMKVHIKNEEECFAISKDVFALGVLESAPFVINSGCQYVGFEDYYIPKASLKFSGADLNTAKPKYDYIDLDYNLNVSGGSYKIETITIPRNGVQINDTEFAEDHASSDASPHKKYKSFHIDLPEGSTSEKMFFKWIDSSRDTTEYGAKIDGSIKLTYADGTTHLISPRATFDITAPVITCMTDPAGTSGTSDYCENPLPEAAPNIEDPDNVTMYALAYISYPRAQIKSIDFDVVGNPNNADLIIVTKVFVDYTETQEISVPGGEFVTTTLASGTFRIYPIEGMSFLLRNYANPQMSQLVKDRVNYCKLFLTNRAWVSADKVYWVEKRYNNFNGANQYCTSSPIFDNATNKLVPSLADIDAGVVGSWNNNLAQFGWLNSSDGNGFWTNDCTEEICKNISISNAGVVNIESNKSDIDSFAPLCEESIPNQFAMTAETCAALGVICNSVTGECNQTTPELFDSFSTTGFIETTNPLAEVVITGARTSSADLDNSAVKIWIEGGILKAMFLGKNYEGYDDSTIELDILNKDVIGDLYGNLNIVDYIYNTN